MDFSIINSILDSNLISSIIGVTFGGYITTKVNNKTEKKRILIELKVSVWNKLLKSLDKINNLLCELLTDIELNKNNKEELLISLNSNLQNIAQCNEIIIGDLTNNTLVIMSDDDFTKKFTEKLKESIKLVKGDNAINNMDNVEKTIEELCKEFNDLYAVLQNKLLEDLIDKKKLKKIEI